MPNDKTIVTIAGRQLTLSNLDKVLYPVYQYTKAHVIDYYSRIAPVLLPHLHGRPLSLKRYPSGVAGAFFYQKECPKQRPAWFATVPVWSESHKKYTNYCVVEDVPSLVFIANLAALELHTSLSLGQQLSCPTALVFDLDPGPPAAMLECAEVALLLKVLFDKMGLISFPKTSGSKGLQVYVPLNTAVSFEDTKVFAHRLAILLEKNYPHKVVSKMSKRLRTGKVFIDWSQNDEHKTTVCVYSLRAGVKPTVSTPVDWSEVQMAVETRQAAMLSFEAEQVLARVTQRGDLFAAVLTTKQKLTALTYG